MAAVRRPEVVPALVAGDGPAEPGAFDVGGPEVDARPDAGVRDFAQHVGQPGEVAGGAGLVAVQGERDSGAAGEELRRAGGGGGGAGGAGRGGGGGGGG